MNFLKNFKVIISIFLITIIFIFPLNSQNIVKIKSTAFRNNLKLVFYSNEEKVGTILHNSNGEIRSIRGEIPNGIYKYENESIGIGIKYKDGKYEKINFLDKDFISTGEEYKETISDKKNKRIESDYIKIEELKIEKEDLTNKIKKLRTKTERLKMENQVLNTETKQLKIENELLKNKNEDKKLTIKNKNDVIQKSQYDKTVRDNKNRNKNSLSQSNQDYGNLLFLLTGSIIFLYHKKVRTLKNKLLKVEDESRSATNTKRALKKLEEQNKILNINLNNIRKEKQCLQTKFNNLQTEYNNIKRNNNSFTKNPYEILGVDKSDDLNEIEKVWKIMQLAYHPDKYQKIKSESIKRKKLIETQNINSAWEKIKKEKKA